MRKRNEGYVLPLVMIVLAVLSLTAAVVLSASLRNLKLQQRTLEQTRLRYAFLGESQRLYAALESISGEEEASDAEAAAEEAHAAAEAESEAAVLRIFGDGAVSAEQNGSRRIYRFAREKAAENVTVSCAVTVEFTVSLTVTEQPSEDPEIQEPQGYVCSYRITVEDVDCAMETAVQEGGGS